MTLDTPITYLHVVIYIFIRLGLHIVAKLLTPPKS
jgi:hypothetical protein